MVNNFKVEKELIEKCNIQNIDILKVKYHGSRTSSSKLFIDETNPKYSIISVKKQSIRVSKQEVLNNLKE